MQNRMKFQHGSPLSAGYAYIRKQFNSLLDLVYPPLCVHCGKVDSILCDDCLQIAEIDIAINFNPLLQQYKHLALGIHQGVLQSAVHTLKYENETRIADLLGEWLAEALLHQNIQFDIIIPVPLHMSRLKSRGYNQATIVGRKLSEFLDIELKSDILKRNKNTMSQVNFEREDRLNNVKEAFSLTQDNYDLEGLNILLLDDVCTTGATLLECTKTLETASASSIQLATVTYAY